MAPNMFEMYAEQAKMEREDSLPPVPQGHRNEIPHEGNGDDESDSDDSDDEGRDATVDPKNLAGLLEHLLELDARGIKVVEVVHCANYWEVNDTVLPLKHHGLVFKLSDSTYLRMHLLRTGLAWKVYDNQPSSPSNLAFLVTYSTTASLTILRRFCADNAVWSWPFHDCEQFAKGALSSVGIKDLRRTSDEKVVEFLDASGTLGDLKGLSSAPLSKDVVAQAKRQYEAKLEELQLSESKLQAFLKANAFGCGVNKSRRRRLIKEYPLHAAVKQNDADMVRLLLRFGANPAKTDSWGRSPLTVAMKLRRTSASQTAIIALLKKPTRNQSPSGEIGPLSARHYMALEQEDEVEEVSIGDTEQSNLEQTHGARDDASVTSGSASGSDMGISVRVDCPRAHGLVSFVTDRPGYCCNICRTVLPMGCTSFGCRICDFDACSTCAGMRMAGPTSQRGSSDPTFGLHFVDACVVTQPTSQHESSDQTRVPPLVDVGAALLFGTRTRCFRACPLNHGLKAFSTDRSGYSCDVCHVVQPPCTSMIGCRLCNFDMCLTCSGGAESSSRPAFKHQPVLIKAA